METDQKIKTITAHQEASKKLGRAIKESGAYKMFEEAKTYKAAQKKFSSDPEIMELSAKFTRLAGNFRQKQAAGTVSQEDITTIRQLQQQINNHPVAQKFGQKQQDLMEILQNCNLTISDIIGFDYSATAAPAAAC